MLRKAFSADLTLTALNGLHAGMTMNVGDKLSLGGELACGAYLLDESVKDTVVDLRVSPMGLHIEPRAGDVTVDGVLCDKPLRVSLMARKKVDLTLGDVQAEIKKKPSAQQGKMRSASLVLVAAGVFAVHSMWPAADANAGNSRANQFRQQAQIAQQTPALQSVPDDFELVLRDQLTLLDLNEAVTLTVEKRGDHVSAVSLMGAVRPDAADRYRRFLVWYDSRQGYPPILSTVTLGNVSALPRLPQIAMIQLTPTPLVIDALGRRYETGDRILGEWAVADISQSGLTLSIDGHTEVIKFNNQ